MPSTVITKEAAVSPIIGTEGGGDDWTLLFKTGDSVDLQLGADHVADRRRRGPVPGDLRLLIALFKGRNVAVLYRHRVTGEKKPVRFDSPWRSEMVDRVELLTTARIAVDRQPDRYTVEAALDRSDLGLGRLDATALAGDFGVIYGDPEGTVDMLRFYWSNQATGLVSDVPGEIMLSPNRWGTLRFTKESLP